MRVLVLVLAAAAAAAATTNATFVCVPRRAQLPAGYAQKHYCEQTPTRGRKWGRKCETASNTCARSQLCAPCAAPAPAPPRAAALTFILICKIQP